MTSHDTRKILMCLVLMKSVSVIFSNNCDEHYCVSTRKCIDSEYLCDGDNDCGDNTDETEDLCSRNIFGNRFAPVTELITEIMDSNGCLDTHVACSEETGSKCIHRSWVCDGEWDCLQGSDERHCPRTTSTTTSPYTRPPFARSTTVPPPEQRCSNDQFRCSFGCINKNWVCDGEKDCNDGSDESAEICLGRTTTQSTSAFELFSLTTQSYSTPRDTPITVDDSSPNRNLHSNKSSDDCDEQTSSSITFTLWNWIQGALLVVGIICLIAVIVFVCKKRKSRFAGLNSRDVEERRQAVSFLNSNIVPECQLVLVGTPVQVQPTVVQTASVNDQPPPYDTQPSPNLTRMQNSTKTEKCLL